MIDEQSLLESVAAVRSRMVQRLEAHGIDAEARRNLALALEELDVLWEELRNQAVDFVRENQRYADFFEYAPDAFVITDAAGQVMQANQAAVELLAVPLADLIGRALNLRPQLECNVRDLGGERRCWLIRAA